jgi:hypothetical protein
MVSPGDRGVPALLGNQPVCAGADHENRAGGLRGGDCVEPGLVALAAGTYGRLAAVKLRHYICGLFFEHSFDPLTYRCRNCGLAEVKLCETMTFCLERLLWRVLAHLGGLPR